MASKYKLCGKCNRPFHASSVKRHEETCEVWLQTSHETFMNTPQAVGGGVPGKRRRAEVTAPELRAGKKHRSTKRAAVGHLGQAHAAELDPRVGMLFAEIGKLYELHAAHSTGEG